MQKTVDSLSVNNGFEHIYMSHICTRSTAGVLLLQKILLCATAKKPWGYVFKGKKKTFSGTFTN